MACGTIVLMFQLVCGMIKIIKLRDNQPVVSVPGNKTNAITLNYAKCVIRFKDLSYVSVTNCRLRLVWVRVRHCATMKKQCGCPLTVRVKVDNFVKLKFLWSCLFITTLYRNKPKSIISSNIVQVSKIY